MPTPFEDLHPRENAGRFTDKPQSAPQIVLTEHRSVKLALNTDQLDERERKELRDHLNSPAPATAETVRDFGESWRLYYGDRTFSQKFRAAGPDGSSWYLASGGEPIVVPDVLAKAAQLPDTTVAADERESKPASFGGQHQQVRILRSILGNAIANQENYNEVMGGRTGDLMANRARTALLTAEHTLAKSRLDSALRQVTELEEFYSRGYDEYNKPFTPLQLAARDPELSEKHGAVIRARVVLDSASDELAAWEAFAGQRRDEGVE
jgi:hypothetical protein